MLTRRIRSTNEFGILLLELPWLSLRTDNEAYSYYPAGMRRR